MLIQLFGGIGLFLMGMMLLTDGLKAFAGDALRRSLMRFTGSPLKALGSGAVVTALVQSSSATTITVIGFVSAGLLSFSHALGVVMGASLGTTTTGWIVSVLGLKVSLGYYALPLVGIGAFLRLLAKGPWRSLGWAVAGFGMIFIGIETMQQGMTGVASHMDVSRIPEAGVLGHFMALVIGIVLTVLMQSSSAAVATLLTALHTGTINFEQAASLMIGAAIGTTVTGALAAIGGSISAQRTALAHVVFNLATGLIAIILLPLLLYLIGLAQTHMGLEPGAVSLAAFHTVFISLGVILFFPFLKPFAAWVEKKLPDRETLSLRHLDDSVLNVPAVALEVTRRALCEIAQDSLDLLQRALHQEKPLSSKYLQELESRLQKVQNFFVKIPSEEAEALSADLRIYQVHAIEHLHRLHSYIGRLQTEWQTLREERLRQGLATCEKVLSLAQQGLADEAAPGWLERLSESHKAINELRASERQGLLREAAKGEEKLGLSLRVLESLRWIEQVVYRSWRVSFYLSQAGQADPEEDIRPNEEAVLSL